MNSLRISIVQYLNTAPLVRGFTHGPLQGKYALSFTVPSQCAEDLRSGTADMAIIPAIEYQRIENLVLLPGLSIASKYSVRSLLLLSKKPVREIASIALDRSSRSTQALTRILCADHWGISPEFFEAEPDLGAMLNQADAALLIGDPALRHSYSIELDSNRDAAGGWTCPGAAVGLPSLESLHVYDVVEEWRAISKRPAVLAVWAARKDVVSPEVVRDFQDSLALGMRQLGEIAAEASAGLGLPAEVLRRYLSENIDYTLDKENLEGLGGYYLRAARLGLIPAVKPVAIALTPSRPVIVHDFAAAKSR